VLVLVLCIVHRSAIVQYVIFGTVKGGWVGGIMHIQIATCQSKSATSSIQIYTTYKRL